MPNEVDLRADILHNSVNMVIIDSLLCSTQRIQYCSAIIIFFLLPMMPPEDSEAENLFTSPCWCDICPTSYG